MVSRWLLRFRMLRDVRRVVGSFTPEQREELRAAAESDLVRFHHRLGRGLRNGFRAGRIRGLSAYCHAEVRRREIPLSFDVLSSVAIREIWRFLQVPER